MTAAEAATARGAYRAAVGDRVADRQARKQRGERHPVRDFLFEYYGFKPTELLRWSPGLGVTLEGVTAAETDWPADFRDTPAGATLDPARFPARRRPYLAWAIDYLRQVGGREPAFGCFGLHEWAMVYRADEVRHGRVPLRMGREGTDTHVEASSLRCTHFDAYRFFTPAAVPRNREPLTRPASAATDQPGCVHVTMDLYRFAFKVAPFCASGVLADAFALACRARDLDMRASPYDLSAYGVEPLPVETRPGREEYARRQRELTEAAGPVRAAVLAEYEKLAEAVDGLAERVVSPGTPVVPPAGKSPPGLR